MVINIEASMNLDLTKDVNAKTITDSHIWHLISLAVKDHNRAIIWRADQVWMGGTQRREAGRAWLAEEWNGRRRAGKLS